MYNYKHRIRTLLFALWGASSAGPGPSSGGGLLLVDGSSFMTLACGGYLTLTS